VYEPKARSSGASTIGGQRPTTFSRCSEAMFP
jgi:hypothetical protein